MIIKISDLSNVTLEDVGKAHPEKAIPPTILDADLRPLGFARVSKVPAPTVNPNTHFLVEGQPVLVDGVYCQAWITQELPAEEKEVLLTGAKAQKKSLIDQERASVCQKDVEAVGHTWQADWTSQDLLNKAIMLAGNSLPLPVVWRDVANVDLPITSIGQLLEIAGAIGQQTQTAYGTSWILKAQVDAATTIEELNAIVWPE